MNDNERALQERVNFLTKLAQSAGLGPMIENHDLKAQLAAQPDPLYGFKAGIITTLIAVGLLYWGLG